MSLTFLTLQANVYIVTHYMEATGSYYNQKEMQKIQSAASLQTLRLCTKNPELTIPLYLSFL